MIAQELEATWQAEAWQKRSEADIACAEQELLATVFEGGG